MTVLIVVCSIALLGSLVSPQLLFAPYAIPRRAPRQASRHISRHAPQPVHRPQPLRPALAYDAGQAPRRATAMPTSSPEDQHLIHTPSPERMAHYLSVADRFAETVAHERHQPEPVAPPLSPRRPISKRVHQR